MDSTQELRDIKNHLESLLSKKVENYLNNPNIAEEELKNMDEKEVHPSSSNDNIMARDYYSILGVQRQLEKS